MYVPLVYLVYIHIYPVFLYTRHTKYLVQYFCTRYTNGTYTHIYTYCIYVCVYTRYNSVIKDVYVCMYIYLLSYIHIYRNDFSFSRYLRK